MATPTISHVFVDGDTLTASQLNTQFNNLLNAPAIMNADIASNAAIATSKINATFPTGTMVGTTDTQTLTNKTLTSPIHTIQPLSGTTPTIDATAGDIITLTMSGSTTWSISNAVAGDVFICLVKQGSGTTYTNTWFSGVTWVTPGGIAPVETTTSGGTTAYGFICTASNTYQGFLVGTA